MSRRLADCSFGRLRFRPDSPLVVFSAICTVDCIVKSCRKVTPYPQGAYDFFPLWPLVALNWPQGAVYSVIQPINITVTLPRERSDDECQPAFSALRRPVQPICPNGQIYQQGTPRVPVGSKLYFLLHETLFAAEKGLPARGWRTSEVGAFERAAEPHNGSDCSRKGRARGPALKIRRYGEE